jgi:hypothetical protein
MLALCACVRLRRPDVRAVAAVAPARALFVASPVPTYRLRPPALQGPSPVPAIRPRLSLAKATSFCFPIWGRGTAFLAPKEKAHVCVPRSGLWH